MAIPQPASSTSADLTHRAELESLNIGSQSDLTLLIEMFNYWLACSLLIIFLQQTNKLSWSWELSVCFLTPTGSGVLRLAGAGMEFLMRLTPPLETLELSLAMFIIWEDILLMGAILTMIFVVF